MPSRTSDASSTSAPRLPRCTAAAETTSGSVTDTPAPVTVDAGTPWAKARSRKVRPTRASVFVVPVIFSDAVRLPVTLRSALTPSGRPVMLAAPVPVRLVPLRAANDALPDSRSSTAPLTVPSAAVTTRSGRADTTVVPLPGPEPPSPSPVSVFNEYAGSVRAPQDDGLEPMSNFRVPPEMICE